MVTLPPTACYDVRIDWYADGDYTDGIDDVSGRVLADPGLTAEVGRDTGRSTGPPMIGYADFVLDNRDRMLSPENAVSPAYQHILPGRPVQIRALHGTRSRYREHTHYRENDPYRGQASFGFVTGQLESFEQHPEYGQQAVSVSVLSTIKNLKRRIVSVPLATDVRTDVAVRMVLDAAGWPADRRLLAVSDSILHQFWVDERPAWDVLVQLVATEGPGSLLYQDGDGILYWRNRNHRATDPRSTTSQGRLTDGTAPPAAGDLPYTELSYAPQWADIITRATVATRQREVSVAPEVVWELGADLTMADPLVILWPRPPDPFISAVAPVAGTDYTIAGGTATVTLDWTAGGIARLTVRRTSGLPVLTGLQLRASPFRVIGETIVEHQVAAPDPTLEKTLSIDAWPELDPNHAAAICQSYIERYAASRPLISVTVPATDGAQLKQLLRTKISDRLSLVNHHLGLVTDVFVERITRQIGRGNAQRVVLHCEPAAAIGSYGAVWDHPAALWDGPTTVWGV